MKISEEETETQYEQSIPLQKFLKESTEAERQEVRDLIVKSPGATIMAAVHYGELILIPESDTCPPKKRKKKSFKSDWGITE